MSASNKTKPLWINTFFVAAAILACGTILFTAVVKWVKAPKVSVGPIADITVNLGGKQVREHCITCHSNGGAAAMGAGETAAGEHPDIAPHTWEALGCTACHLGEGMALDVEISHGLPGLGARQVLKGSDLQASCYTCHPLEKLKGAEKVWAGYQLFLTKACDTCHRIEGLGTQARPGPDLTSIGSHLGLLQIQEAIRDPQNDPVNSNMPRYPLSRSQIRNISYFLKSRVKNPFHSTPMIRQVRKNELISAEPSDRSTPIPSGEKLIREKKCLACHQFRKEDGRIAPDLTFVGSMRPPDYLHDFIKYPARRVPGASMPPIYMPVEEEDRLVQFLDMEAVGPLNAPSPENRYMRLCQRCHAANGDGKGLIQPNLACFPRAFMNNQDFFRNIPDSRIRRSVGNGIPGTSMPPYKNLLSEQDSKTLLDLIFKSFIGIGRHEKATLARLPDRPEFFPVERAEGLYKNQCQRCHGKARTGTGRDYLLYLPRPRNLTNTPYFSSIDDNRIGRAIFSGIPGTAMPAFKDRLSDGELWMMVDRVRFFSKENHESR